jgi:hypothetical protein
MCTDVFGPVLDQNEGKRSSHHLSLLQYSFNLNIAIKKLISIEMTEITTEHDLHIIEQSTDTRSNVLLSQSIQRKNEVVMKANSSENDISSHVENINDAINSMKNEINKLNLQYSSPNSSSPPSSSSPPPSLSSDLNTIQNVFLGKLLSELNVDEVGKVLESIKLDEYKAVFAKNKIDGKCLMECITSDDVVNMGIRIFVKARIFLNKIMTWKATGVPIEYLSANLGTDQDDR